MQRSTLCPVPNVLGTRGSRPQSPNRSGQLLLPGCAHRLCKVENDPCRAATDLIAGESVLDTDSLGD
jgi:hypothetical protein